MLEDGFSSDSYSAVLENLRSNDFLNKEDVENLIKEYLTTQRITLDLVSDKKAKIVVEALIDNYNRLKSK
ncbi:hypothetical protein K8352_15010 [Flavobacteriaceae bacterium F89]|uniref:Uncharacterized protein n=1 Tax=Cerina litoralis TaxID=2874477 RepID=A0AAE3EWB2_9FLAO|nr:hypothetical protein [Cerina litoralis]MCG2462068.1 hypothetical protein [Cerina litoralis]